MRNAIALILLVLLAGCEEPGSGSTAASECFGLTGTFASGVDRVTIGKQSGPPSVFCVAEATKCSAWYTFRTDQAYSNPLTVSVTQSGANGTQYSPECNVVSTSTTTASCSFSVSGNTLVMNCGTAPRSFERI